ncbi:MAG: DUF935 family protein [Opitutaceae bacterium]|nr:DUF935 family protein [Opitutaceae bacterium]
MSTPLSLRRANKWRAALNPLRGFAIQRAVGLLEEGERGAYAGLMWAYRFLEKRQATLRGLKRLRGAALGKLDWDIKLVDTGGDAAAAAEAQAHAQALRSAYDRIENIRQAVRFLALAEFRGFAHLEKRYEGDNPALPVVRLDPVDQWHWCRDTYLGPWQYNARAAATTRGEAVELSHFIVREVEDPINEIALLAFAAEGLGKKDWAGFVEVFGIPPLFGELPPDMGDDKKAALFQEMMEAVIGDMRGTIPSGAKIHTVGEGARGVNPFRDFLEYFKEEIVLAGTSGKLTMLSSPTGIGSGPTDAHQDAFDDLAQAEAGEISEIFQEQFDKPLLAQLFTGRRVLAYFELAAEDKADIGQVLDHALKASQAGMRIDLAQLSEKTGYKLTATPVAPVQGAVIGVAGPGTLNTERRTVNRAQSGSRATGLATLDAARRQVFAPLLAQLDEIRTAKDPAAYADALEDFRAEVTRLTPRLVGDPSLGSALEAILGEAAAEGAVATLSRK